MIRSIISLTISLYTPYKVYCEMYPTLEVNTKEKNFNIPLVRMTDTDTDRYTLLHTRPFHLSPTPYNNLHGALWLAGRKRVGHFSITSWLPPSLWVLELGTRQLP